jgi:hypothetical protein
MHADCFPPLANGTFAERQSFHTISNRAVLITRLSVIAIGRLREQQFPVGLARR